MFLRYFVPYQSADLHAKLAEIVKGESLRRRLNVIGVAKYSEVGHIESYISETVQDTASGKITD